MINIDFPSCTGDLDSFLRNEARSRRSLEPSKLRPTRSIRQRPISSVVFGQIQSLATKTSQQARALAGLASAQVAAFSAQTAARQSSTNR
jgi:hypothetical protein